MRGEGDEHRVQLLRNLRQLPPLGLALRRHDSQGPLDGHHQARHQQTGLRRSHALLLRGDGRRAHGGQLARRGRPHARRLGEHHHGPAAADGHGRLRPAAGQGQVQVRHRDPHECWRRHGYRRSSRSWTGRNVLRQRRLSIGCRHDSRHDSMGHWVHSGLRVRLVARHGQWDDTGRTRLFSLRPK